MVAAVLAGSTDGGYSLRPWSPAVRALPAALNRVSNEPLILVQSALYPHAGYDSRIQLLTPHALQTPMNVEPVLVLTSTESAYPFNEREARAMLKFPRVADVPGGIVIVRRPGPLSTDSLR